MTRTGRAGGVIARGIALFLLPLALSGAWAGEATFTAEAEQAQVSSDESVGIKFTIRIDGDEDVRDLRFSAPDFEGVNEFISNSVESYYRNGKFGRVVSQQIKKYLRPLRTGTLSIRGIQVTVGGRILKAPDLQIEVTPPGRGTAPPRRYGGSGVGLRGAGKRSSGPTVMVRAELDKERVFKGEQIVVSYYLYRRLRVMNIQVEKFPELKGFLREEMEMPVMGSRLDTDRVLLDGVPYDRSLLVRYAAYPLQEGKLKIDPIALKYNYFPTAAGMDDGEDPFLQFFRQMQPRIGSSKNDPLTVEVTALPSEGRPENFSGGVGDFNVTSAVDKYEVRANEAVTLTVKVEGRGNLAAIGEPKVKWPDGVELYDTKGKAKTGKAGVGEKVFELLLIPRVPGKLTLPGMDFSFFDPRKKTYLTKSTPEIGINVLEPAPGSALVPVSKGKSALPGSTPAPAAETKDDLHYLKPYGGSGESSGAGVLWQWIHLISVAGAVAVALLIFAVFSWRAVAGTKRAVSPAEKHAKGTTKEFQRLVQLAKKATDEKSVPWSEVSAGYEGLCDLVFSAIDMAYGVGARSHSRSELQEMLVAQNGLALEVWNRISRLLESAEMVRFASSAGAVSEQNARKDLKEWVNEAETIVRELSSKKLMKS